MIEATNTLKTLLKSSDERIQLRAAELLLSYDYPRGIVEPAE